MPKPNIPIEGTVQHYAWGGYEFLPEFLRAENPNQEPWAELWMGSHAKGPANIGGKNRNLRQEIDEQPALLGREIAERFDHQLPYLLKVLDVRQMLSIQVHPNKEAAEEGFSREEENGPPQDAPDRNYRDDNHKPELGVAVTDFYLLHGFRSEGAVRRSLQEVPGWSSLLPVLDEKGVSGLYAHVMKAEREDIDRLLQPLVDSLNREENYHRDQPEFWAKRAVEQYTEDGHHDRGMFSIYWFNLVHLRPRQGIFQDAGIPHAYLEGVCIELMANSDNVLRGGLTPKHIDVEELMANISFSAVEPRILAPAPADGPWTYYPTPAPDFRLYKATTETGQSITVDAEEAPAILLLMEGRLEGDGLTLDEKARTAFVPAGNEPTLRAAAKSTLYYATVGDYK